MKNYYQFKPTKEFNEQFDDAAREKIVQIMKQTSQKPAQLPKRLHHATAAKNLDSILKNGLQPHEVFGEIYLCEKANQTTKFIPNPCVILSVDVRDLDPEELYLSKDHTKTKQRNFESFAYYKTIEPDKLTWKYRS